MYAAWTSVSLVEKSWIHFAVTKTSHFYRPVWNHLGFI